MNTKKENWNVTFGYQNICNLDTNCNVDTKKLILQIVAGNAGWKARVLNWGGLLYESNFADGIVREAIPESNKVERGR